MVQVALEVLLQRQQTNLARDIAWHGHNLTNEKARRKLRRAPASHVPLSTTRARETQFLYALSSTLCSQFLLVVVDFVALFRAVAAQKVGQILGERRSRHHRVAARFDSLGLQVALQVRKKSHDRYRLLQLGLQFRNQRQRLGVDVVQVEHDQRRLVLFLAAGQLRHGFLLVLDECDLYALFPRGFLDLRGKEEVFDKEVNVRLSAFGNRDRTRHGMVDRLRISMVPMALARKSVGRDGRRGRIGKVPIHLAIAVVHRADEAALLALAAALLALALETAATIAIAIIGAVIEGRSRALREAVGPAVAAGFGAEIVAGVLIAACARTALAVAELLFPAFSACTLTLRLLGPTWIALPALLRRGRGRGRGRQCETLAFHHKRHYGSGSVAAFGASSGRAGRAIPRSLALALAPPPPAALGLSLAMLHAVSGAAGVAVAEGGAAKFPVAEIFVAKIPIATVF